MSAKTTRITKKKPSVLFFVFFVSFESFVMKA